MDTTTIRANLLKSYLKLAKGKKGIIYSVSRKHSDHICAEFKAEGINIVRIDSETPREERRLYVQRFKKGLIDIIVNVDIFSEGFDCPDIEFIQLARPTKSLVKYLQQVGRGLRPTAGKARCVILDNVGSHIEFDLPDADRDWDKEFVGELTISRKRASSSHSVPTPPERTFDEGTEELGLIQDIESPVCINNSGSTYEWKVEDDALLRTLSIERKCSIDIIATVFNISRSIIVERLTALGINCD